MALTTVNVSVHIDSPSGNPVQGAKVIAKLNRTEVYQGHIVPEVTSVTTDINGDATLALWPNSLGSTESSYEITIINPAMRETTVFTATIPNSNVNLWEVADLPAYPGKSDGEIAAANAANSMLYAQEWADKAVDALISTAAGGNGTDDYSALHHATKAAASATAAAASESNAATSETNAATSASNAATSEANAALSYDQFDDRYLGDKATDPTLDNDGNALLTGALYFNTSSNVMRVYNGTTWQDAASSTSKIFEFSATAAQTSFTGADKNSNVLVYDVGFVQVSRNGVILDSTEFTATDGSTIVLQSAAALGDDVRVFSFGSFSPVDAYTKAEIDANRSLAVGDIIARPTSTAPSGYLHCNGAAISRTTYADLFSVIGTNYGAGDGSTTFNIPDLRGEFLRGWDNAAGNDPDAATRTDRGDGTSGDVVGSKQLDAFKSHTHNVRTAGGSNSVPYIASDAWSAPSYNDPTSATGGNETRPRNVSVMFCIKY